MKWNNILNFLRILENTTNSTNTTIESFSQNLPEEYVWGAAIGVSIGFLLLSFILTSIIISCVKDRVDQKCLATLNSSLISMAIGSLVGDSVVHIIPDIFKESIDIPIELRPNPHITSLVLITGFILFFTIEKIFLLSGIGHSHGTGDSHNHEHNENESNKRHIKKENSGLVYAPNNADNSHQNVKNIKENDNQISKLKEVIENNGLNIENFDQQIFNKNENNENNKNNINLNSKILKNSFVKIETVPTNNHINKIEIITINNFETTQPVEKKEGFFSFKNKKPVGCMTLISSIIHNSMDGIAIGVVFASRNNSVIVSTCIALILHEIPKELGDAGILLVAKFKIWSVLFWNVAINIFMIVGALIGLGAGDISEASKTYTLAFVAGNFFYIALVDMVPEIIKQKGVLNNFLQFFFILLGIGLMFVVLMFESEK